MSKTVFMPNCITCHFKPMGLVIAYLMICYPKITIWRLTYGRKGVTLRHIKLSLYEKHRTLDCVIRRMGNNR